MPQEEEPENIKLPKADSPIVPDLVQTRNPKTGRYVLIDRSKGAIISHRESKGPYEGVPFAVRRTIKDPVQEGRITIEEARRAARFLKIAREVAERNKEALLRLAEHDRDREDE